MTESRAELNAGLVIVTGHAQVLASDVDMGHSADFPSCDTHSNPPSKQAAQGTTGATAVDEGGDPRVQVQAICHSDQPQIPSGVVYLAMQQSVRTSVYLCSAWVSYRSTARWATPDSTARMPSSYTSRMDACMGNVGEWVCKLAFPVPAEGTGWPRHGHGQFLRPDFFHRAPPFLTGPVSCFI